MKITRIETFTNKFICFVKVTIEDQSCGWGQVAPYCADITAQVLHRQIAPYALGENPREIDKILEKIRDKEHKFPGSYIRRAMGGLDTALWDWRGKKEEKSVCELIGGTEGSIRAYASSMKRDITPDDEAERMKKLKDEKGFNAFKFRIGAEVGHDKDEWEGRTEEIVPKMKKKLGDDVDLLVDANSCYSPDKAIEIGYMLQDNGIAHYEEPCPYWEFEQTKKVKEKLDIDVTGGEQDCMMDNWKRMIEGKIVDIIQPDICYLGGMNRTLKVAKMAQEANIPVTPHCANLSMVTLFTMHLLRAIPNAGKYLEFSIEKEDYYPWQIGLFDNDPFKINEGKVKVEKIPGWGAEINRTWIEKAQYQKSEIE